MTKKIIMTISMLIFVMSFTAFADANIYNLDDANRGVLTITYPVESGVRFKAIVESNNQRYVYDLTDSMIRVPLQMGEGTYQLSILKNIEGDTYSYEYNDVFQVEDVEMTDLYLNSIQNVNWHNNDFAIQYLEELVNETMSDMEKTKAIHKYIAESYEYDYEKFDTIQGAYLPDINETFEEKTGICYDFTSLLAAMLRSEGISTKLVMGYRADSDVYHAWNEVYLNGQWQVMDATLDCEYVALGYGYEMFKDASFYTVTSEF